MFDYNGDYPFLEIMFSMLVFFAWFVWFWLLITLCVDIFRRSDVGGGKKAVWIIFLIIAPFLGVLCYIIANGDDMAKRNIDAQKQMQSQFEEQVRSAAGSTDPSTQIANAKALLDSGAISAAEFEALKKKALS